MRGRKEALNIRDYRNKMTELRRTIRVLVYALLALTVTVAVLAVCLVLSFKNFFKEKYADARRFSGKVGLEYKVRCDWSDKTEETVVSLSTDVLEFYGKEYETVAKAIDEYFAPDELLITLRRAYDEGIINVETVDLECTKMNDTVVSIKENIRCYAGGGFSDQQGINFSVKTGKILELDDILSDKKTFYKVIEGFIVSQLPICYPEIAEACPDYSDRYKRYYTDNGQLPEWHLEENGLAFSFNELEFLDKSHGCIMVVVPYELVRSYIKEEYLE